jgi:hypothetical protein
MLETDQLKYRLEYGLSISIASTARSKRLPLEIAIVLRWKDPRFAHTGTESCVTRLTRFGIHGRRRE